LSRSALDALQALHQKLPDSAARTALKTLLDHQLAAPKAGAEKT